MKKSKILAPALAILCLSTAASVTGTVAWFAANNVVNATGMAIKSTTPASLVIGKSIEEDGIGNAVSISWTDAAAVLSPVSTYHGTADDPDGVLYEVTNGQSVDPSTGLAYQIGALDPTTNLPFSVAPTLSYSSDNILSGVHYKDYVAYIGSYGEAITIGTGGSLTVTLNFGTTTLSNKAASVDFWILEDANAAATGDGVWKGTLNAAGISAQLNHGAREATPTTINTVTLLGPASIIPTGSGETALKVVMRMYFDGALQDTATSTYVRNFAQTTADVTISASFNLIRGTAV